MCVIPFFLEPMLQLNYHGSLLQEVFLWIVMMWFHVLKKNF